ncbi:MAG TPA: amidase family protein [Phenylobacterium sp.]|nr:amidase family protein [Phenylobacterium sp.]
MSGDILDLDATGQLAELAAGRVSATELLTLAMERRDRTHARLNAVVTTDPEGGMAQARAIDAARARGEAPGPLAGLPMTIKDTLDVAGMPASSGLAGFRDRTCEDAVSVARARAAGAVLWGKTNVPVMAADWQSYNSLYGTSNNPWDVTRTTGGSSGGAACALASGVTALEIGSDIGGSLRVPASFCGVYSHKPSWGAVSQIGHVPPAPGARAQRDLNVVGPLARSARDLKLLFSLIADSPAPAQAAPALKGLRVGLWLDEPLFPLDPEVKATIEAYAAGLAAQGVAVEPVRRPVDVESLVVTYRTLLGSVIFTDLPPEERRQMVAMRPMALEAVAGGAAADSPLALVLGYTATHAEWLEADEVRARLREQAVAALSPFDVIMAPVAATPAFPHDHAPFNSRVIGLSDGTTIPYTSMLNWIGLATACGLPATCVPAGLTAQGLPVGVQLIGPPGGDARTLAVAEAFEAVRGFVRPPGV